jgi:hypothetical protein
MLKDVPVSKDGGMSGDTSVQSHWVKYVCVLISGYLEQAIKEILIEHADGRSPTRASNYVRASWPSSRNMNCDAIDQIVGYFDDEWSHRFSQWLDEDDQRKKEINEIVKWRNSIAHGNEAATTNVTIVSVKTKFKVACELVGLLEKISRS